MMRSKLFVPAIRPDLFEKALRSGTDAVCFDLEDAVAIDRKQEAREHLKAFLSHQISPSPLVLVRTNACASAEFLADITACVSASVHAIALPKVENPEEIVTAAEIIGRLEAEHDLCNSIGILPTLESPRGLRMALEIASSSRRVIGLQIGFADLVGSLGIASDNLFARDQVRLMVRLAAGEAGLDCYDSAYANFKDAAGYNSQLRAAASMGFSGTSCIHPSQVHAANLAFTPSAEALSHARRLITASEEAAERGEAVTSVDGKMVDRPFILEAKRLLAQAPKGA